MRGKRGASSTRTTIISIIVLDLIIMSLFLFFSNTLLKDFQQSSSLSIIVISSFAIVIPGTLLILIVIQFVGLYKNKFGPGYSFKRNIVFYFILATLLAIVPQAFISINFINTATDNWLNKDVNRSVDTGFKFAINLENRVIDNLENLGHSKIFRSTLRDIYNGSNVSVGDIKKLNSWISAVELIDANGHEISFLGDEALKETDFNLNQRDRVFPRRKIGDLDIIKSQTTIYFGKEEVLLFLTAILPSGFSENAMQLTKVKKSLDRIGSNKSGMNFGMILYYMFFSIPLFLLAILGSFIFSDEIVKPIANIEEAIRKVAHGNYSYRILSKKKNEFNILISSFNHMIKEIEKSRAKLKHTEQISTWQDIATRLAHEIRNPLTPIKLSAQRVLFKGDGTLNKMTINHMETIIREVVRMEKLLTEFRDFARFPQVLLDSHSIKETIEDGVGLYLETYPNVEFSLVGVEDIILDIDKNQILQVISNLTINAIHAMDDKGKIFYSSQMVYKKGQNFCRVSIKDNGHGISQDMVQNIFKPYYTTKYNGSGLGLAIVNKIILDHKGKIWIETAVDIGTTFYFELPVEMK